jgi:hypothetical protein
MERMLKKTGFFSENWVFSTKTLKKPDLEDDNHKCSKKWRSFSTDPIIVARENKIAAVKLAIQAKFKDKLKSQ